MNVRSRIIKLLCVGVIFIGLEITMHMMDAPVKLDPRAKCKADFPSAELTPAFNR